MASSRLDKTRTPSYRDYGTDWQLVRGTGSSLAPSSTPRLGVCYEEVPLKSLNKQAGGSSLIQPRVSLTPPKAAYYLYYLRLTGG